MMMMMMIAYGGRLEFIILASRKRKVHRGRQCGSFLHLGKRLELEENIYIIRHVQTCRPSSLVYLLL
jgi:hypothetical protein